MEALSHLDSSMTDKDRAIEVDVYQAAIMGKHVGHSDSIFVWNDVDSPLLPLVVQIELLNLIL